MNKGEKSRYSPRGNSSVRWCFGGSPTAVEQLHQRDWQSVFSSSLPAPSPPFCLIHPQRGRAVADTGQLSRAQGCLLGQLAGDALGGLVEFQSSRSIRGEYPDGIRDLKDGGGWHNLAGQPTDDSELALMLARAIVHLGRYDAGAGLDSYVHWWPHAWDIGNNIRRALEPASAGKTTAERLRAANQHANRSDSGQSNGSLMRISPLGIFGVGRPQQAAEWAREDSRLTHPHPICQDACAVFVAAIAATIADGLSPRNCYETALRETDRLKVQVAVRQALEHAQHTPPQDYQTQMGWVLIALQNAFYQLLHAPNLEEGIVDTVMRGGDTDTNAAIAGALLGAVHGRRAVPARWMHALLSCRPLKQSGTAHPQPCEFWPVDALELAERLLFYTVNS